jgi:hypothetical protein
MGNNGRAGAGVADSSESGHQDGEEDESFHDVGKLADQ